MFLKQLLVLSYEAEAITALRSDQRNLYKLACQLVARRAELKAAYDSAGVLYTPKNPLSISSMVESFGCRHLNNPSQMGERGTLIAGL